MMKTAIFSFLIFIFFSTPSLAEETDRDLEAQIAKLEAWFEETSEDQFENIYDKLIERQTLLGKIFQDFPHEWPLFKQSLKDRGRNELDIYLGKIRNGEITNPFAYKHNWGPTRAYLDSLRATLEVKYFPYYLSQADNETIANLLKAFLIVFEDYERQGMEANVSCFQWLEGGMIFYPENVSPETSAALDNAWHNLISSIEANQVREFSPFLENTLAINFYRMLISSMKYNYGLTEEQAKLMPPISGDYSENEKQEACKFTQLMWKLVDEIPSPGGRAEFLKTMLIVEMGMDDHVKDLIETRKEILASQ